MLRELDYKKLAHDNAIKNKSDSIPLHLQPDQIQRRNRSSKLSPKTSVISSNTILEKQPTEPPN